MPAATATQIIVAASIWALFATPASAAPPGQSIVDAYAGQALVLGKPVHVRQTPAVATARLSPTPQSGGSQATSTSSANAVSPGSAGAPGPSAARGRHGASAAGRTATPLPSRTSATPAASLPSTAVPDLTTASFRSSGGSFNWIDMLALVAGALGLALAGAGIRRLSGTPV